MNTDRLIDMLSTHVEPARRSDIWKTLALALVVGLVAAFAVMLVTVGERPNLTAPSNVDFVAIKLAFAVVVIIASGIALLRLAKPGGERLRLAPYLLPVTFALVMGAIVGLDLAISAHAPGMMGSDTLMCLGCIPLFAILPFVALIFALRQAAPTDLRRAGALAGLLAGGVGAAAYALHCPDDSFLFITVWYGAALAFCTAVGATIGPRLLRW